MVASVFADVKRLRSALGTCQDASREYEDLARTLHSPVMPAMPAALRADVENSLRSTSRAFSELGTQLVIDANAVKMTAQLFEEADRTPGLLDAIGLLDQTSRLAAVLGIGRVASAGSKIVAGPIPGLNLAAAPTSGASAQTSTAGIGEANLAVGSIDPSDALQSVREALRQRVEADARATGRRVPQLNEECMVYAQYRMHEAAGGKGEMLHAGGDGGAYNVIYEGNHAKTDPLTGKPTAPLKAGVKALEGVSTYAGVASEGDALVFDSVANSIPGFPGSSGHIAVVEMMMNDQILVSEANNPKGEARFHWYTRAELDHAGVYVLPNGY